MEKQQWLGYALCRKLMKMLCHNVFLREKLKWLTRLAADGRSLGWKQAWQWAEVSARDPGGPEDSDPWDWTITGERPLTGETGLRAEVETWQLDGEGEDGGAGDWRGLGDGLWAGDGSLCGIRGWVLGEWQTREDADDEASKRLRANRALLALAELLWVESLGGSWTDRLGSGSIGRPPGRGSSLSEVVVQELLATSDLLSSTRLPSLSPALSSSSCLRSEYWRSFCLSGGTGRSSQTPRTEKKSPFNTFSNQLHSLVKKTSISNPTYSQDLWVRQQWETDLDRMMSGMKFSTESTPPPSAPVTDLFS